MKNKIILKSKIYNLLLSTFIYLTLTSCSVSEDQSINEPMEEQSIQLAVGINKNIGLPQINSVYIDNTSIPLTILNSEQTTPDCSSFNSFATLPPALNTKSDGIKFYFIKVTYSMQGVDNDGAYYTKTDTMAYYASSFDNGCNVYQVSLTPNNTYSIVKM
ncbi:hypothetical protein FLAN108750_03560 [Flavobacterium antarcticum]|uniref:hypothetical protein n=1 Tax=Flavobacterium antarcticum TaxID=271155 RepID=UPI0003B47AA9|nr:hypothetical protein [Flavobacterium antarcticum]